MLLCLELHSRQINIPYVTEAHVGFFVLQSKQTFKHLDFSFQQVLYTLLSGFACSFLNSADDSSLLTNSDVSLMMIYIP